MAQNTSRIAKNTLYLYLRSLIVLLISLYTSRVVLNILGVEDYGIFNVVGGVIGMLEFIRTTMLSTFQRFFNYEMGRKDDSRLRSLFKTSLSIQIITSLLFIILAETIGLWFVYQKLVIPESRLTAAIWVYQFSIIACVLTFFSSPFCAAIISHERMNVFAVISILDAILKLVICFLLTYSPFDKLIIYSFLLLVISFTNLVLYAWYSISHFKMVSIRPCWSIKEMKEMLSFSGWTIIDTMAGTFKTQGLNIVLNLFFGPIVNAARAVAAQILNSVMQFTNSFQTAFRPQLTKSYASGDREYLEKLYYSSTKFSFYLMFVLSMPLIIETPTILRIWLGNTVPDYTVSFSRLVLITAWLGAFANPTSTIAYATGEIRKYSLTASLFNLAIVPIAYVVLLLGGSPESSMVVSLIIAIITQVIRVYILYRLTGLSPLKYCKMVVIPSILCCLISYFVVGIIARGIEPGLLRLFITCFSDLLASCLIIWFIGLNQSEKDFILAKISSIIIKIRK